MRRRVLKWLGHVERIDAYRTASRVLMADVSGGRVRWRQRLGWMDGVRWPIQQRNDGGGCPTMRE